MTGPLQFQRETTIDPKLFGPIFQTAKDRTKTTLTINPDQPIQVVEYSKMELGKLLGTGSFSSGIEIKRINQEPCENLVMKKLRPEVLRSPLVFAACAADLKQEGSILATLSHPNIIRLEAWSGDKMIENYLKGSFVSSYLILERLHETLEERISKWNKQQPTFWHKFSKRAALAYLSLQKEKSSHILSLTKALQHCHSHRILHRDLKAANIGFDATGTLKVFDFDLARVLPEEIETERDKLYQLTANVGSPRYMAPEVSAGDLYNLKADVYSFGVLAYQMFTCKKPYGGMDQDWSTTNKSIPIEWKSELRTAMQKCLSKSVVDRPDMESIQLLLAEPLGIVSGNEEEQRSDRETTLGTLSTEF